MTAVSAHRSDTWHQSLAEQVRANDVFRRGGVVIRPQLRRVVSATYRRAILPAALVGDQLVVSHHNRAGQPIM